MNPCPCGYYPDYNGCHCTMMEINRYQRRIPGPIMDRFDLCVAVPRNPVSMPMGEQKEEKSEAARARMPEVGTAREKEQQKKSRPKKKSESSCLSYCFSTDSA